MTDFANYANANTTDVANLKNTVKTLATTADLTAGDASTLATAKKYTDDHSGSITDSGWKPFSYKPSGASSNGNYTFSYDSTQQTFYYRIIGGVVYFSGTLKANATLSGSSSSPTFFSVNFFNFKDVDSRLIDSSLQAEITFSVGTISVPNAPLYPFIINVMGDGSVTGWGDAPANMQAGYATGELNLGVSAQLTGLSLPLAKQ